VQVSVPVGVAVYPADDALSLHVRSAGAAQEIPGRGARAYLDIEAVIAAAKAAGCDALHPGYGFLSENASLARRCAEEGIVFIGPSPEALDLMRSYAAGSWPTFWKLRLPSALPYLFTSLKVAATASVIGALVAELPAGSKSGVGVVIINAAQYYNSRPPVLYAAVLVAASIGLLFYGLVALAEKLIVKERKAE